MAFVELAVAKTHLRDPEDDDTYLILLLSAAEDQAAQFLDRNVYADEAALAAALTAETAGERPIVANDSIRAATLLILGHLYANREDVITGTIATEIPLSSRSLLMPYRIGMGV